MARGRKVKVTEGIYSELPLSISFGSIHVDLSCEDAEKLIADLRIMIDTSRALDALIRKGIVQVNRGADGKPRYTLTNSPEE
jgi:hypothetical protein